MSSPPDNIQEIIAPNPLKLKSTSQNFDNRLIVDPDLIQQKVKIDDQKFHKILNDFEHDYKDGKVNYLNFSPSQLNSPSRYQSAGMDHTGGGMQIANEIDWFGFQTQLRKIVYELVEPTVKRALSSENQISQLTDENINMKRKIDELEFAFQKSQKRSVTNDDVTRKIFEFDQSRKVSELKIRSEVDNFKDSMMQFRQRLSMVEDEAVRYQNQTKIQQNEVAAILENFESFRQRMSNQMVEVHDNLKQEFNVLKDAVIQYELPIQKSQQIQEQQRDAIKETQKDLELLKSDYSKYVDKIENLQQEKTDLTLFEELKRLTNNSIQCLNENLDELKGNLTATDNYLDKYLPVKILNYIHDTFVLISDKKELMKLFDYLAPQYQALEQQIANDNGKPNLQKQDFFLPILDINLIQQQRNMQKQLIENSSSLRGVNSSQKSNSQISGFTRDDQSDKFRQFKSRRLKHTNTKQSHQQSQYSIHSKTNNQQMPIDYSTQNKQKILMSKKDQGSILVNKVSDPMDEIDEQQEQQDNPYTEQSSPNPWQNIKKPSTQFEEIKEEAKESKSKLVYESDSKHSKQDTQRVQSNNLVVAQEKNKVIKVLQAQSSPRTKTTYYKPTTPKQSIVQNHFSQLHSEIKQQNQVQQENIETPNASAQSKNQVKPLPIQKISQINQETISTNNKAQHIKIPLDSKNSDPPKAIDKKLFSESKEEYIPFQALDIDEGPLNYQQSFQGATFHKSPPRNQSLQKRKSTMIRQSSIEVFKALTVRSKDDQDASHTLVQDMKGEQDELNLNDEDNIYMRFSEDDDQNQEVDDMEESENQSDGSDTFSGNRVVNKKLRTLKKFLKRTRRELIVYMTRQSDQNVQFQDYNQQLRKDLQQTNNNLQSESKLLTNLIHAQVNQESSRLKLEVTKRYDDITTKIQDQINEMIMRRKRELSDNQFFQERLKEGLDNNNTRVNDLDQIFQKQIGLQKQILESLMVLNLVVGQDEQDKQSLALLGFKTLGNEHTNHVLKNQNIEGDKNQMIKIDKNCMSCSNNYQPQIKQAFKMACLAYQPQPIDYNGKKFDKTQLINNTKGLIEKILNDHYSLNYQCSLLETDQNLLPQLKVEQIKKQKVIELDKSQERISNKYVNQSAQATTTRTGIDDDNSKQQNEHHRLRQSFFQQLSQQTLLDQDSSRLSMIDRKSQALLFEQGLSQNYQYFNTNNSHMYDFTSRSKTPVLAENAMKTQYKRLSTQHKHLRDHQQSISNITRPTTTMHSLNNSTVQNEFQIKDDFRKKTQLKIELMRSSKGFNQLQSAPISPRNLLNKN